MQCTATFRASGRFIILVPNVSHDTLVPNVSHDTLVISDTVIIVSDFYNKRYSAYDCRGNSITFTATLTVASISHAAESPAQVRTQQLNFKRYVQVPLRIASAP